MRYTLLALVLFFAVPHLASAYATTTGNASNFVLGATLGYNTNQSDFQAQPIITVGAGTISQIVFAAAVGAGAPSDDVDIDIQTDSGGSPSGVSLGSTSDANVAGGCTTYTVTTSVNVSASTKYWLVFRRTGALSTVNYYNVCGWYSGSGGSPTPVPPYRGFQHDATWVANNVDFYTTTTIDPAATVPAVFDDLFFWLFD